MTADLAQQQIGFQQHMTGRDVEKHPTGDQAVGLAQVGDEVTQHGRKKADVGVEGASITSSSPNGG